MDKYELLEQLEQAQRVKFQELKEIQELLYHQRAVCQFEISLRERKRQKESLREQESFDIEFGY
jgi:hypothetical protein